jgi:hypothetical protein
MDENTICIDLGSFFTTAFVYNKARGLKQILHLQQTRTLTILAESAKSDDYDEPTLGRPTLFLPTENTKFSGFYRPKLLNGTVSDKEKKHLSKFLKQWYKKGLEYLNADKIDKIIITLPPHKNYHIAENLLNEIWAMNKDISECKISTITDTLSAGYAELSLNNELKGNKIICIALFGACYFSISILHINGSQIKEIKTECREIGGGQLCKKLFIEGQRNRENIEYDVPWEKVDHCFGRDIRTNLQSLVDATQTSYLSKDSNHISFVTRFPLENVEWKCNKGYNFYIDNWAKEIDSAIDDLLHNYDDKIDMVFIGGGMGMTYFLLEHIERHPAFFNAEVYNLQNTIESCGIGGAVLQDIYKSS